MNASFEEVWTELRTALKGQRRCREHPEFPCVHTLGQDVPNDVVKVDGSEVVVRSHRTLKQRPISRNRFEKTWKDLGEHGAVPVASGNNGCVVSAIWVQCLPNLVEWPGGEAIRLVQG